MTIYTYRHITYIIYRYIILHLKGKNKSLVITMADNIFHFYA